MRIAEISNAEEAQESSPALARIESLIALLESNPGDSQLPRLADDLRSSLSELARTPAFPLPPVSLHLWKLSFRLWNSCVDLSNGLSSSPSPSSNSLHLVRVRHVAADMLLLAGSPPSVPSPLNKTAFFFFKTGSLYLSLQSLELASSCLDKSSEILSRIDPRKVADSAERKLFLDVNLARARVAWECKDVVLAVSLLSRSRALLFGSAEHHKALANQYLSFGKTLLGNSGEDAGRSGTLKEALKLMNGALELCEKGLGTSWTRTDTADLHDIKLRSLRFIAAVHLQMEEFEGAIKCVRVLKEEEEEKYHHPSLPVLAMKAWLGLGKHSEAEKELRGMVANKGIPEGVWVSAVEEYFKVVGTAGAETAKGVFMGLLGRCHVSAGAAVRVVARVASGGCEGEAGRLRAKVVAELVSEDRVTALFAGDKAAKERNTMHVVLWNCAAEHFRLKDYRSSAEMFEKSMLYVPSGVEDRVLLAKGYRVLCLCHLGLSQLDRAEEYINEAEKLEPNIASAFLKFKVYLLKNDHGGAIAQIQTFSSCLDFTPDILLLSTHEAVACHALPVAVASLSSILNLYALGKEVATSEVIVLRTLITVTSQIERNDQEILKALQRASARAEELGVETFFGKGEVGTREVKWLAITSWNFGTKAGRNKKYEECAQFLKMASYFYNLLGEENQTMLCRSLILTVCAMLASETQRNTPLLDSELKQAKETLDRAAEILEALSTRMDVVDEDDASLEAEFRCLHAFISYDIHKRVGNSKSQLGLVKSFAVSKACNPRYLLQIALTAAHGPGSNLEVASFALHQCLADLLSSVSPSYENVALVIRKLIMATSTLKGDNNDQEVYDLYKKAYHIMVGLKEGEYPTDEGKWLVTTAWNRAAIPVRLGQIVVAKKWMDLARELAGLVPGTEVYRVCMDNSVALLDPSH
ncbi:hypothetical protein MLD38_028250 [Melastoma candidum]|uniref:Uncharacterized protein n=1 Tax=Melastoma candidum TaxID=119954 RepID=A0ACB9N0A6_9MYRT|nr:hypothetical protein MLD38_028250 [Melastoma candidum]